MFTKPPATTNRTNVLLVTIFVITTVSVFAICILTWLCLSYRLEIRKSNQTASENSNPAIFSAKNRELVEAMDKLLQSSEIDYTFSIWAETSFSNPIDSSLKPYQYRYMIRCNLGSENDCPLVDKLFSDYSVYYLQYRADKDDVWKDYASDRGPGLYTCDWWSSGSPDALRAFADIGCFAVSDTDPGRDDAKYQTEDDPYIPKGSYTYDTTVGEYFKLK
jgi:hypothetical protein